MNKVIKGYMKKIIIFLTLSLFLFMGQVLAQSSFPAGGNTFETAVEIKPGQYSGGRIGWEEYSAARQVYYLDNVKSGQAIEATVKFFGDTNFDISLYDSNKTKLTYVFGGEDIDPLVWQVGSPTETGKYYLVIENTAINEATDVSLDLKISDKFDAGSSVDASDALTESLSIPPGSYQGYFSGEQGNDNTDFYSLKLKKGNPVSVKITPPKEDSINLAVYDVNRSKLDENSSVDSGEITTLSFAPANDGEYYLELSCYYGCTKLVSYKMEISGAVLPTGGGLMTTDAPSSDLSGAPLAGDNSGMAQASEQKARDQRFILIIVLTVIAIIVIVFLILRKKPVEKDEPQVNSGSPDADKATVGFKHPCIYCGKLIPPNSRTCPFCGKNNPQGPLRCPRCNTPIERDWKVCNHCDLPLSVRCPKCGKTTFFGDYCEHCGSRLTVVCPHCQTEQPPIGDLCKKCKKPLAEVKNKANKEEK